MFGPALETRFDNMFAQHEAQYQRLDILVVRTRFSNVISASDGALYLLVRRLHTLDGSGSVVDGDETGLGLLVLYRGVCILIMGILSGCPSTVRLRRPDVNGPRSHSE